MEYPENYKFVSLGNQEDYPNKNWSDPIRSTIENIEENHFALHWDDVFPIGPMRERLFEEAIELVKSEEVQKVDFFFGAKNQHATSLPFNDNFVQLSQYVDYRSGLVPGIYNKEYFLKYLDPKMTCWDYEVLNIPRTTNDGAIILLCRDEPILPWINMYDKGEFNINHLKQLQSSKSGRNFWVESISKIRRGRVRNVPEA